jgi:xanthine dehydrogenase accessory factor
MSELNQILELWKRASAAGDDLCLATVVGLEGSAYRRPGARMLLAASGLRSGTVSGGCLEGEIAKKAWWLTAHGPSLQSYSSFFDDDGDMPYGLGCGGTVTVLLERGIPAAQCLETLRCSVDARIASVIVAGTRPHLPGTTLILRQSGEIAWRRAPAADLSLSLAQRAMAAGNSLTADGYFAEYVAPPPALYIFGAGDDAQPLVQLTAALLGWYVTVADGRSRLVRADRFPHAARVLSLGNALGGPGPADAAVLMSHSYEQDRDVLRSLLPLRMKYLGILGPRQRTGRLVGEVAPEVGLTAEECLARLHTPVGLDLGGHSPAAIALSIAAELQAIFTGRSPKMLSAAKSIHG